MNCCIKGQFRLLSLIHLFSYGLRRVYFSVSIYIFTLKPGRGEGPLLIFDFHFSVYQPQLMKINLLLRVLLLLACYSYNCISSAQTGAIDTSNYTFAVQNALGAYHQYLSPQTSLY